MCRNIVLYGPGELKTMEAGLCFPERRTAANPHNVRIVAAVCGTKIYMNRELIVNVNPTEISIALCEDKVLVELNKEQCQTGFAVGDIYLGKVQDHAGAERRVRQYRP